MAPTLAPDGTVVDDGSGTTPLVGPGGPINPASQVRPWGAEPESAPPMPAMPADPTAAGSGLSPIDNPALGPVLGQYVHKNIPGTETGIDVFQPGHRALMQHPGNYQLAPSYGEASTDPLTGQPTVAGGQSKLGKVLSILRGAGMGFAVGAGQPTIGRGFMAATEFADQQAQQNMARRQGALQLAQARQNLQFYPYLQRLGMMKTQAEIAKSQAETGKAGAEAQKATAEAGAIPTKQDLEKAQTEAAYIKNDPILGAIDIRTRQPLAGDAGYVTLTNPQQAAILRKNVGDRVPISLATKANTLAQQGWRSMNANGRALLVNDLTKEKQDWGTATPLVTMNYAATGGGLGPFGAGAGAPNANPAAAAAVAPNAPGGFVTGDGRTLNSVPAAIRGEVRQVLEYRRADPSITQRGIAAQAINQWVSELDPLHDATTFPARNQILRQYETDAGSGEIGAINTALGHLGDLYQASQALNQNNLPLLHSIASKWGVATGGTAETLYKGILDRVGPELTKAYLKGGGSMGERGANEEDFALGKGQQQIQDNIFEAANLLNSKLASKRNNWEKTFSPYRDQDHFDTRFITPEARQVLQALGSRSPIAGAGAAAGAGGNRPALGNFGR